jgi:hypothetical protein
LGIVGCVAGRLSLLLFNPGQGHVAASVESTVPSGPTS